MAGDVLWVCHMVPHGDGRFPSHSVRFCKLPMLSWEAPGTHKSHLPNHQPDIICDGHIMIDGVYIYIYSIYLGKLEYFTHLNSSAIKGDDSRILTI